MIYGLVINIAKMFFPRFAENALNTTKAMPTVLNADGWTM
jgi:hypothetical protein